MNITQALIIARNAVESFNNDELIVATEEQFQAMIILATEYRCLIKAFDASSSYNVIIEHDMDNVLNAYADLYDVLMHLDSDRTQFTASIVNVNF